MLRGAAKLTNGKVNSIVENTFHPRQDAVFRDYLVAAHAAIKFRQISGRWPSDSVPEDRKQIHDMVPVASQTELVGEYIDGL